MDKKKQDYSQFKPFLIPVVIFVLIFLTVFLVFIPQSKIAWKLYKEVDLKKANLAQLTQKQAVLQGLDLFELEKKNELVIQALPVKKQPILVLNSVKNLGESKGLTGFTFNLNPGLISTTSAETKKKISASDKNKLALFVSFDGSLKQITDFVQNLEKLLPVVKITDLVIKAEEENFSNLSLSLVSFYLSLPESLGTAEAPVKNLSNQEEEIYSKLEDFAGVIMATTESQFINSGKDNPFVF
jgi:Tfp pilus assembly protein PilO